MHLLVSFCNVLPGGPQLGVVDLDLRAVQVPRLVLPAELERGSGITGLALSDRFLFAVVQQFESSQPGRTGVGPTLLVLDRADLRLVGHYTFQLGRDVHSLCWTGETLLAVSTGTDELLELRLHGERVAAEVVRWSCQPQGPRQDANHLNSVYLFGDRVLVSGFGMKSATKWSSAGSGFVIDVDCHETLISGVHHPHSLTEVSGGIALCESSQSGVRMQDKAYLGDFPGYTRGLCAAAGGLFVGSSVGRQISRSAPGIQNPASPGKPVGACCLSRLSLTNFAEQGRMDLGSYAREIYDLLPVEGADAWPVSSPIEWRDAMIGHLSGAYQIRTDLLAQAMRRAELLEAAMQREKAWQTPGAAAETNGCRGSSDGANHNSEFGLPTSPNAVQLESNGHMIHWNSGGSAEACVYVSRDGGPEVLFVSGMSGSQQAPWIHEGVYRFRLYSSEARIDLLTEILVERR